VNSGLAPLVGVFQNVLGDLEKLGIRYGSTKSMSRPSSHKVIYVIQLSTQTYTIYDDASSHTNMIWTVDQHYQVRGGRESSMLQVLEL
jgi:DhnA family fructose-bisphosphate aldolase class Ia